MNGAGLDNNVHSVMETEQTYKQVHVGRGMNKFQLINKWWSVHYPNIEYYMAHVLHILNLILTHKY